MTPFDLLVNATTTVTTSSSSQTPICSVYQEGPSLFAQGDGCSAVAAFFLPTWITPVLYGAIGVAVVFISLYIVRVYFEYPIGRGLWRNKEPIGILCSENGVGDVGKLYPLTNKAWWYASIVKKGIQGIVFDVPDGLVRLPARLGGATFAYINATAGTIVNPKMVEDGKKLFGPSAKGTKANRKQWMGPSNWKQFMLTEKERRIKVLQVQEPRRSYPPVPADSANFVVTLVAPNGQVFIKRWPECNDAERDLYKRQVAQEDNAIEKQKKEHELDIKRIEAIRSGQDFLVISESRGATEEAVREPFTDIDKTLFFESIDDELATDPPSTIASVGSGIDWRYMAQCVGAMVTTKWALKLKNEVEDQERRKKKDFSEYMKVVMPIVILMIVGVVCFALIEKVL